MSIFLRAKAATAFSAS